MAFGGNGDGTAKTMEIYRNQTWEYSQNSLENDFDFGVSVKIKCPAWNWVSRDFNILTHLN